MVCSVDSRDFQKIEKSHWKMKKKFELCLCLAKYQCLAAKTLLFIHYLLTQNGLLIQHSQSSW